MKGLNWKTILAGLCFYLFLEYVVDLTFYRVLGQRGYNHLTRVWVFNYGREGICSLLAGYISAGNEPKKFIRNEVAVFSMVVLLTSANGISWLLRHSSSSIALLNWSLILALTFPCLWLGGYLRARRQPRPTRSVSEVLQPPIPLP